MTISLNIENDEELRLYIKDCIKGQVLGFTREKFQELIETEFQRKIENSTGDLLKLLLVEAVEKHVRTYLRTLDFSKIAEDVFRPMIEQPLQELLVSRDWSTVINSLAQSKLQSLLANA